MTTVWPRWMSGAVGSAPSLTRSGLPARALFSSFARRSSSRMTSTAPLRKNASCSSIVMRQSVKSESSKFKVEGRPAHLSIFFFLSFKDAPPLDLVAAGADERERLGVGRVLFGEDARGQRLGRVGVSDG